MAYIVIAVAKIGLCLGDVRGGRQGRDHAEDASECAASLLRAVGTVVHGVQAARVVTGRYFLGIFFRGHADGERRGARYRVSEAPRG